MALCVLLTVLATSAVFAQTVRHTFRLEYVQSGFSRLLAVPLRGREVVFRKEPDFGGRKIVRGALPVRDKASDFVGFAWDHSQRTLHVDSNRNLDLTDDPLGVYTARSSAEGMQKFEGVAIESKCQGVPITVRIDFRIENIPDYPQCGATVLSGWRGEIELHGRRWSLGLTDLPDGLLDHHGTLVLEPPSRRDADPSIPPLELPIPNTLFLDGRFYTLAFSVHSAVKDAVVLATFSETNPPLGLLEMDGRSLGRVVLEEAGSGGRGVVVLDSPSGTTEVPVGSYRPVTVHLFGGKQPGAFTARHDPVTITHGHPVRLKAGGPLKNTVTVARTGGQLQLEYQLLGVGGEKYSQTSSPMETPPRFTITRGDQTVATGAFEYG